MAVRSGTTVLDGLHNYRGAHVVLAGIQERYIDYYLENKHDQKQEFYGAEAVIYYRSNGINLIGRSRVYSNDNHPQHIEVQHADGASYVDVTQVGGMLVSYDFSELDPTLVEGVKKTLVERIVESSLSTKVALLTNIAAFNARYKKQVIFPVAAMQPAGGWIEEGGETAMFGDLGGLYPDDRFLFTLTKEQLPTQAAYLHGRVMGYFTDGQLLVAVEKFSAAGRESQAQGYQVTPTAQRHIADSGDLHELGLGDGYHQLVVMVNRSSLVAGAPLPETKSEPSTGVVGELKAPKNLYGYTRTYNSLLSPLIALAWDIAIQERHNFERGRRVRFADLTKRLYESEIAFVALQLRGTQLEVEFALLHLGYFRQTLSKSRYFAGYPAGHDFIHVQRQLDRMEQRLLERLRP